VGVAQLVEHLVVVQEVAGSSPVTHPTIASGHTGGMTADAREALMAKRAELKAREAELTAAPDSTGGISFGKRVGDGTSIAVERLTQVAAHEQMLVQFEEIERALVKIDEGTYGECDSCGAVIPEGRLEIHPWAVLCVPCASGD
jgi:DnaK suppressor protein